jgi:hypothetical protein
VPLTLGVAARIDGITSAPVTVGATPHRAGPPAPAWLGAAPGNRGVRLAWLLVPGASFYTVTVGTSTVLTTATSVNVGNLRNGVTLVAQVTATVAGIVSPPRSITVTPRLPAPASLQGSGSGSGVTLRWARVVGASGYVVSGDGVASRWVGATATTFSGLDARSRTFLVRAADATDRSGPSPAVTVRTLTRPARLAATPGTGRLTVTWGAVTGATGYLIWRDNVATPVRTTSRTVVLGGLARGSRHTVRVAAVTANSTSERSSVVASAR